MRPRSRLVAVTSRTSTRMVRCRPAARTRAPGGRAAAWVAAPGGYRRSRRGRGCPGRPASKRPSFCAMAPVKAPLSWPNSSLSSRPVGMAAQLTLTKVRSRRRLRLWMARAMSSLPVPLSPLMKTVESVGATVSTSRSTRLRAALSPTISSKSYSVRISSSRYSLSLFSFSLSSAICWYASTLSTATATWAATRLRNSRSDSG